MIPLGKYTASLMFICIVVGCSTPKKMQRTYGFSDDCRKSYELFIKNTTRDGQDLIEFIEPVNEVYHKLLADLSKSYDCWYSVLPEKATIELLGLPHERIVNYVTGDITIRYFIRTKYCMNLEEMYRPVAHCGLLELIYTKEGIPKSGLFYALHAAKKE